MNQEIMKVLSMVEEGKLTSEDGAKLIETIKKVSEGENHSKELVQCEKEVCNLKVPKEEVSLELPEQSREERTQEINFSDLMLKIRINSHDGDKVNVTLPLNFVKGMVKACGKIPNVNVEGIEGVNGDEIMDTLNVALDSGMTGKIVDINTGDGDIVEIVIE